MSSADPLWQCGLGGIAQATYEQDAAGVVLLDQEQERVVGPERRRSLGMAFLATATTVAAVASVPSSFTSTNAL